MTVKARAEITLAGVSDGAKGDKGDTGATGKGIKSTAITYQSSTSNTTAPTGTWSSTIPSVAAGSYLWTRTIITYTDNTTSTSYSVAKQGSTGAKGDKGDTGATGADGKMLYGTCSTAAATAAKVATATGFKLVSGTSVSIKFTYANTAASPTLNINSLGAKAVYVNGTRFAYWAAGSTVTFVYDGTKFQVCSVPVYANTVTVGNPASQNVYIDSDSVDIRNGSVVGSSFSENLIELGKSSSLSKIDMANGSVVISGLNDSTFTPGVTSQIYVPDRIKMIAGEVDTETTPSAVSYVDVNRDTTDSAYPSANVNISAQTKKSAGVGAYTALTLRNIGTVGIAKLTAGQTSVAVQEGFVGFGAKDNSPKTTFNIDGYNRLAATLLWSGTCAKGGTFTCAAMRKYTCLSIMLGGEGSTTDLRGVGLITLKVDGVNYVEFHGVASYDSGSESRTMRCSLLMSKDTSNNSVTMRAASDHKVDGSDGTSLAVYRVYGLF